MEECRLGIDSNMGPLIDKFQSPSIDLGIQSNDQPYRREFDRIRPACLHLLAFDSNKKELSLPMCYEICTPQL